MFDLYSAKLLKYQRLKHCYVAQPQAAWQKINDLMVRKSDKKWTTNKYDALL